MEEKYLKISVKKENGVQTMGFESEGLTNYEIVGLLTIFRDDRIISALKIKPPDEIGDCDTPAVSVNEVEVRQPKRKAKHSPYDLSTHGGFRRT